MKKILLFLTFCLFVRNITVKAEYIEQQFHCDENNTIYKCGIWTDGYYAIKTKTYDEQPKFEIEDYLFDEIKEGIFDYGNLVIENGIIKKCQKCNKEKNTKSPFLIHKYIVFNKIKNYQNYIQQNKIDNLKEFNKNGYFLVFRNRKDKNDNKYLFIFKDLNGRLKSVYNDVATFLYFYDENYFGENFDLFYLDVDDFTYEKFNDGVNSSFCDKKGKMHADNADLTSGINKGTTEEIKAKYDRIAKEVQNDKELEKCFLKVYSLENDDRLFNEDVKKIGDNIAIFNKIKREKIENMIKKVDYDFLK